MSLSPAAKGSQGSCVGWAVAYALKTYHERTERGWPLTNDRHLMSPAYVYNQIKVDVPGGGAYLMDAFNLLLDQGVSSWARMPYSQYDDDTQPSAAARAEAANYKIADWGAVMRTTHAVFVQEIKHHLVARTPVVIGVSVYPDFVSLSESNPIYDDASGRRRGGHAIVIVGYDDRRSAFKIINSWGTDWGIGGYGWIDYQASEELIHSAYVTKDVVASPDDERPVAASDPSPGTEANGVPVDTVLTWTRNGRTTSFDVYLGTDRDLGAVDFQGNVAQATFSPDLAPGSRYYWRVDARGAGGVTRGPMWSFTTAGSLERPGKAVNPSPADGATGVGLDTTLSWHSGGQTSSYDVYFGRSPTLGASDLQRTQAGRTFSPDLAPGARYYWRVDARGAGGVTRGPVWSFTTAEDSRELPGKAINPSPANGATGVPLDATLSWVNGGQTSRHDVYFGTTPTLGASDLQRTHAFAPFSPGGLSAGRRYYWRIDAKNNSGTTTGDLWTFITADDDAPTPDPGTYWRVVDSGTSESLEGVAWSGGRFVAVGNNGTILTSLDGSTWTPVTSASGASRRLWGIAWGDRRFVAVGSTGTGASLRWAILTSPDGIRWTAAESDTSGSLSDVAWNGTRFVAVGGWRILTSPNGTEENGTILASPKALSGVTWGGGRFVAVGDNGTILTSPEGIIWTITVSGTSTAHLRGVAWGDGRFVAVGSTGTIVTSTDGTTWRDVGSDTFEHLSGVAWGAGRFIAVTPNWYLVHSTDGVTWTAATHVTWRYLSAVAWGNGRFVAVGPEGRILTSP